MRFKSIILFILMSNLIVHAYDFEVDRLYYTIKSESQSIVAVTGIDDSYNGALTIPETVSKYGTTYQVNEVDTYFPKGVTTVNIPKSILKIKNNGRTWGNYLYALKAINIDSDNPNYSSIDGVVFNKDQSILYAYPVSKTGQTYTIPNTVTRIDDGGAFWEQKYLRNVVLSNNLTVIGERAFDLTKISSIDLPESLDSIKSYAFNGCPIASMTLPNHLRYLGTASLAFEGAGAMTEIFIPASVDSIENCLTTATTSVVSFIEVDENNLRYSSENGILYNKSKTELVSCPAKLEGWITIPKTVTSLREWSFLCCDKITRLTLPASLKYIGAYAFRYSKNISRLTMHSPTPPSTDGDKIFEAANYLSSCNLYVPKGSKYKYQNHSVFKQFSNIIESEDENILATGISLNYTSTTMSKGDTFALSVSFTPEETTDKSLQWISSNEAVAKVNNDGVVSALNIGEAIITVKTLDGSNLTATCHILVTSDEGWITMSNTFDKTIIFKRIRVKPTSTSAHQNSCIMVSPFPHGYGAPFFYINTYNGWMSQNSNPTSMPSTIENQGNGWYEYELPYYMHFHSAEYNAIFNNVKVFVEYPGDVKGDVNMDNEVNIADVNSVIDIILGK